MEIAIFWIRFTLFVVGMSTFIAVNAPKTNAQYRARREAKLAATKARP